MSNYTDLVPARKMIELAEELKLLPARTVCECSVGPFHESISTSFRGRCNRLLLVEPLPRYADAAERSLGIKVNRVAVGMEPGRGIMVENRINGGATCLKGTWSPEIPDGEEFEVDIVTFDTLDDGEIDIFNLDCEGQEWSVICKMKSRPKLFCIEICHNNPFAPSIKHWLETNQYEMICHTGPYHNTQTYLKR